MLCRIVKPFKQRYDITRGRVRPIPMTEQEFWDRFKKLKSGCWHWTGTKTINGYGTVHFRGRRWTTHRLAFFLNKGGKLPRPNTCKILHHCDNPPCGNPDHLFVGTQQENIRDCIQKGPRAKIRILGEKNPNSKFSLKEVKRIRRMNKQGISQTELASIFGVNQSSISRIIRKESRRAL